VGLENAICALEAWAGWDETTSFATSKAAKQRMSGVGQRVRRDPRVGKRGSDADRLGQRGDGNG